jgi:hypothetical protein
MMITADEILFDGVRSYQVHLTNFLHWGSQSSQCILKLSDGLMYRLFSKKIIYVMIWPHFFTCRAVMTAGAMPSVLDNFQSEEPSLEATVLELEAVNIRSSGTAHSSGADTVVCSEMLDGLDSSSSLLPSFVGKSDLTNTLLKPDSLHRPVVNSRSRQQQHVGLMEIDRRSETSSEQTKASKFKVVLDSVQ